MLNDKERPLGWRPARPHRDSSQVAQPAQPLPPSKAFSSAQVAAVGGRKGTLQVQSTNYFTSVSQTSLLLAP